MDQLNFQNYKEQNLCGFVSINMATLKANKITKLMLQNDMDEGSDSPFLLI